MRSRFLFPHSFKLIGWVLLVPGLVLGYLVLFHEYKIPGFETSSWQPERDAFIKQDYTQTLALALVIAGVMFIAFAKERLEDELTAVIRYNALYWAILINYSLCGILTIAAVVGELFNTRHNLLGSFGYIIGISIYNLFSALILFLSRYYYLLYSKSDEYKLGKLSFLPYKPYRNIGKYLSLVLLALFFFSAKIPVIGGYWSEVNALLMFSLLIWIFSRQKHEDEMVSTLRMESMQLALCFNYGILFLGNLFIYKYIFFYFMILNLVSVPAFFLIRFEFMYYRLTRNLKEPGV